VVDLFGLTTLLALAQLQALDRLAEDEEEEET